jgi:hypothetical protein
MFGCLNCRTLPDRSYPTTASEIAETCGLFRAKNNHSVPRGAVVSLIVWLSERQAREHDVLKRFRTTY